MHSSMPLRTHLALSFISTIAEAVASVISLRRELVRFDWSDDECEAAGVPCGHSERAITMRSDSGSRWCHFAIYVDHSPGSEGFVDIRAFGWSAEVFYVRKSMGEALALL